MRLSNILATAIFILPLVNADKRFDPAQEAKFQKQAHDRAHAEAEKERQQCACEQYMDQAHGLNPICLTADNSPAVDDVQRGIKMLQDKGDKQNCTIAEHDDEKFFTFGNTTLKATISTGYNVGKCVSSETPLYMGCAKLAGYFQSLVTSCQSDGKIQGRRYVKGGDIQGGTNDTSCQNHIRRSDLVQVHISQT